MARIPRVVVPGYPHHVTQRGSHRQPTFFHEEDYRLYKSLLKQSCERYGVSIWAYCLMPNHVHLIAVPETPYGLSSAVALTHQSYARIINQREGWTGHLWQGRFSSAVMDESYLWAAVRFVELNPVRSRLVDEPGKYRWSSARAHLEGKTDGLVDVLPMPERISDWGSFLSCEDDDVEVSSVKAHTKTGRPLGCNQFIAGLEKILDRPLKPKRKGRKKKWDSTPIKLLD